METVAPTDAQLRAQLVNVLLLRVEERVYVQGGGLLTGGALRGKGEGQLYS